MENNYFDKSPVKTLSFYVTIILLLFFWVLSVGIDVTEFLQHEEINIPAWLTYVLLGIDVLALLCVLLMYIYRKIGVFIYPILIVIHLFMHEFYLSTLLYSDVFNLFIFVGVGLLAIIPKWNFFK